ncbi:uncharacterized protein LOC9631355 [Selaginella moellendorffii]|uniref:uncharacterized protein LOC9631355 n=1 Tax=Selaginella moellendorffii TaxID=88036 RepID=UPI000D1C6B61|nr:uncharacterized protein LOC9631355 [Selaginella moellendorffii]|eukprot:XP_024529139.1 uncharacterized protein LOC9631355 [Selaginella moellendorffii]
MVKNWSERVEELLDEGNSDGAAQFLQGVVDEMQSSQGADANLSLAAAMQDLGALYERQGLSIKADSLRSSAIVIRHRLNARSDAPSIDKEDEEEEEWEKAAHDIPGSSSNPPPSRRAPSPPRISQLSLSDPTPKRRSNSRENAREAEEEAEDVAPKQRGRGAFTYGRERDGFHSDHTTAMDDETHEELTTSSDDIDGKSLVYGASHVLVLGGFPPKTTTRDLEQVVMPYASRGVVIRWVNDTTALAVFRNPTIAREALATIRHPTYVLKTYDDSSEVHGLVTERDLEPPTPRPATSARAAQRMIVGALTNQGIVRGAQTRVRFTAQELQKQEEERKQRLLAREKLREEAWGGD